MHDDKDHHFTDCNRILTPTLAYKNVIHTTLLHNKPRNFPTTSNKLNLFKDWYFAQTNLATTKDWRVISRSCLKNVSNIFICGQSSIGLYGVLQTNMKHLGICWIAKFSINVFDYYLIWRQWTVFGFENVRFIFQPFTVIGDLRCIPLDQFFTRCQYLRQHLLFGDNLLNNVGSLKKISMENFLRFGMHIGHFLMLEAFEASTEISGNFHEIFTAISRNYRNNILELHVNFQVITALLEISKNISKKNKCPETFLTLWLKASIGILKIFPGITYFLQFSNITNTVVRGYFDQAGATLTKIRKTLFLLIAQ